ncbi:MAG: hypothetical protein ACRDCE_18405, partial [Cetobacterium sp.]|uniref:hypothetical protein n=1 Tax=Cetobacterium sp. TaxID=2071632 RepID=UPI003EE580A4
KIIIYNKMSSCNPVSPCLMDYAAKLILFSNFPLYCCITVLGPALYELALSTVNLHQKISTMYTVKKNPPIENVQETDHI